MEVIKNKLKGKKTSLDQILSRLQNQEKIKSHVSMCSVPSKSTVDTTVVAAGVVNACPLAESNKVNCTTLTPNRKRTLDIENDDDQCHHVSKKTTTNENKIFEYVQHGLSDDDDENAEFYLANECMNSTANDIKHGLQKSDSNPNGQAGQAARNDDEIIYIFDKDSRIKQVVYNNYKFSATSHHFSDNSISWKCCIRNCSVYVRLLDYKVLKYPTRNHTHPPMAKIEVDIFARVEKFKMDIENRLYSNKSLRTVYDRIYDELIRIHDIHDVDLYWKPWFKMNKTLRYHIKKADMCTDTQSTDNSNSTRSMSSISNNQMQTNFIHQQANVTNQLSQDNDNDDENDDECNDDSLEYIVADEDLDTSMENEHTSSIDCSLGTIDTANNGPQEGSDDIVYIYGKDSNVRQVVFNNYKFSATSNKFSDNSISWRCCTKKCSVYVRLLDYQVLKYPTNKHTHPPMAKIEVDIFARVEKFKMDIENRLYSNKSLRTVYNRIYDELIRMHNKHDVDLYWKPWFKMNKTIRYHIQKAYDN